LWRKKYITIYNGIEGDIYKGNFDVSYLRHEFGIEPNQPVVGIIASLSKQKAHGIFLKCAEIILKKIPEARFLIIGDGQLRDMLERQSNDMGLQERVIFTGVRHDIPELLNFINVFTLSSDWEGFPMTILEAMAAGKPCVVTDVGGNREAIMDGVTGFLVPKQDPMALAEKIVKLLIDKRLSQNLGEEARRRFEKEFNVQSMVSKTEQVYLECLGFS
jgi:glycosyltransferase involved in cell wall biosynthesis